MSSKPFDVTLKDLVEVDAAAWPALLGPWPFRSVSVIDADVSTLLAEADKVIRVEGPDGAWLLNLEPESGYAGDSPERMHLYATVLHHRHHLPVRSIVLLLRREANASNLTGEYRLQLPDESEPYAIFRYRVVRLWEVSLQTVLGGHLGTLPLAPLTDEGAANLPGVIGRIGQRLRDEADSDVARKLWAATFVLMGLRYPAEVAEQLLQGVTAMEESTTYQLIVSRGRVAEARQFLLRQGRKKFGPPDPVTTTALEAVTDLERLEQLGERLLDVSSWQELLAPPSP